MIVSVVILSTVPPISKDALIHHLAIPKLYLEYGGIYEMPSMPFSYYPMNLDLLYLIPLYFGNDIAPKLIHFSFALLTAWLIFSYLRHRLNTIYALFGVVFFLSIPIIVKLSITVYVDLGVILFSTAALLLLLKWIETGFQLRFLTLSAVLCGLAMGTKYNGLISFFLLTLFVAFVYSRYRQNKGGGLIRPVGYGIFFFLIALLVFSPWMIRNYYWKSNPIYPLCDKWLNSEVIPPKVVSQDEREKTDGIGLFAYRSIVYGETWWQIALLPVRIFFEGKDGAGQYFDGRLNPFLLILPIFAFLRTREDQKVFVYERKIMLVFAVLFFLFAFFSTVVRIRYISPVIPPLVILSVFGAKGIIDMVRKFSAPSARRLGLTGAVLIIVFSLSLNARYLVDQFRYVDPFTYIGGSVSRDEYISKYCPEYLAMRYVSENLPSNARCLFVFLGKRGYYCDRYYIPDTPYQVDRLYRLIRNSRKPHDVWAGLNSMGISHLIIHIGLFEGWVNAQFNRKKQRLLKDFFGKYVDKLYAENAVGVFRLIEDS